MGQTEGPQMTNLVKKACKTIFPRSNITPIQFHRMLVTRLFKKKLKSSNAESFLDFLHDVAGLMNTSTSIMVRNYNRYLGLERNRIALETINASIFNQNTSMYWIWLFFVSNPKYML